MNKSIVFLCKEERHIANRYFHNNENLPTQMSTMDIYIVHRKFILTDK